MLAMNSRKPGTTQMLGSRSAGALELTIADSDKLVPETIGPASTLVNQCHDTGRDMAIQLAGTTAQGRTPNV